MCGLVRRTCSLGPRVVHSAVVDAGVKIRQSKKAKLGYGRGPNPAVDCVRPHGKGVEAMIQRGDQSASQRWVREGPLQVEGMALKTGEGRCCLNLRTFGGVRV